MMADQQNMLLENEASLAERALVSATYWEGIATKRGAELAATRYQALADAAGGEVDWYFPHLGFYEADSIDEMVGMFGELYTKTVNRGSWIGADACLAFKQQILADDGKRTDEERKNDWSALRGLLAQTAQCSGRYIDLMIQAARAFPSEYRYPEIKFTLYLRLLRWDHPTTALGEAVMGRDGVWSTRDIDTKRSTMEGIAAGSHLVKQHPATMTVKTVRMRDGRLDKVVNVCYTVSDKAGAPLSLREGTAVPVMISLWDQAQTQQQNRRGSGTFPTYQTQLTFGEVGIGWKFVWLGNCVYEKIEPGDSGNALRVEPDTGPASFGDEEVVWIK